MKIPLNAFEQHIDETILKRGLSYFKKGLVEEPEEISPGEFESIVEGTDTYTVRLTIKNEILTDYSCTCPYDFGPICKHIAAVLFYMQQDALDIHPKPGNDRSQSNSGRVRSRPDPTGIIAGEFAKNAHPPKKHARPKKLTVSEQIHAILEKMTEADLKTFISENCDKDRTFRQYFLSRYLYLIVPESRDLYARQVKAILKANTDQGYIGYHESDRAGSRINDLVRQAENALTKGQLKTAIYISEAVLWELREVFNYADDSNGYLSDCVSVVWDILFAISETSPEPGMEKELFEFCIQGINDHAFEGWDWEWTFFELAIKLAKTEKDLNLLESLLESTSQFKPKEPFVRGPIQEIQHALIQKKSGSEEAEKYLEQNLENPDFRKKAVELALNKGDYDRALTLAREGVRMYEKDAPGWAMSFRQKELAVYQRLGEKGKIISQARLLLLSANDGHETYYKILKANIPQQEWADYVDQLLNELMKRSHWTSFNLVAHILIWEERWENLLLHISKEPTLNTLDRYQEYIVKDYSKELALLYRKAIFDFLLNHAQRTYYQTACKYMRKLRKMGEGELVDSMVTDLRKMYSTRYALLEEMNKV